MADFSLDGLHIALLATTGFEQVELTKPRAALDEAGATTHLVSPQSGNVNAWDGDDWGDSFDVDRTLTDASPNDYDALVLPGGVMNPDYLRDNDDAVAFVRRFIDDGKPVGAICHGPWTLIEADAVRGRRITSFSSIKTDLKNAGAEWVDEEVVVDDLLVTSRNPDDLPAFNDALLDTFGSAIAQQPQSVS
jgi:protease I